MRFKQNRSLLTCLVAVAVTHPEHADERMIQASLTQAHSQVSRIIPEAGKVDNGAPGEWAGLFFHRAVLEIPDGALIAAMYGNFEQDTIPPTNPRSKSETKFKLRAFVVRSTDSGKTWRYLSTVATPQANVVDDSDGRGEKWVTCTVTDYAPRSAYPTIFEVEPNVLVYQADLEVWRIELAGKE